jgi:hypothetical protein
VESKELTQVLPRRLDCSWRQVPGFEVKQVRLEQHDFPFDVVLCRSPNPSITRLRRASRAVAGGGCYAEGLPQVDEPEVEVASEVEATETEPATA